MYFFFLISQTSVRSHIHPKVLFFSIRVRSLFRDFYLVLFGLSGHTNATTGRRNATTDAYRKVKFSIVIEN